VFSMKGALPSRGTTTQSLKLHRPSAGLPASQLDDRAKQGIGSLPRRHVIARF